MSTSVGSRLSEERAKLGLSQVTLADRLGIARASQQNYEADKRHPDADYLTAIAGLGADVQYILTGVRSMNLLMVADEMGRYGRGPTGEKKEVDIELLQGVIAGVDGYLADTGRTLKPADKAELIMLLLDVMNRETIKDRGAVSEATAKIIKLRGRK